MSQTNASRYGKLSIAMHWIMLLLIIAVYACVELHEFFPKESETRGALMHWHFVLGMSVLALMVLRILGRLIHPAPPITPAQPALVLILAKLMHLALYAMMIFLPLAGWLMLSAAGKPIPFWGLELPALISENRDLAKQIKEWHETVAVVGYWLIGLHAAAAIYHHHFKHDDTLTRMLPCKCSKAD